MGKNTTYPLHNFKKLFVSHYFILMLFVHFQSGAVQPQQQSGQIINRPAGQQFIGQQPNSFQQTAPRVPQSGTIAQTGFAVESSGNFPAATGHTLPNAGMPYKSANVGTFQQNQFGTNLGYTQISSTTTNQSDMGTILLNTFI